MFAAVNLGIQVPIAIVDYIHVRLLHVMDVVNVLKLESMIMSVDVMHGGKVHDVKNASREYHISLFLKGCYKNPFGWDLLQWL